MRLRRKYPPKLTRIKGFLENLFNTHSKRNDQSPTCQIGAQQKRQQQWWEGSGERHSDPVTNLFKHLSTFDLSESFISNKWFILLHLSNARIDQRWHLLTWIAAISFWDSVWISGKSVKLSQTLALWPRLTLNVTVRILMVRMRLMGGWGSS